MSNEPQPEDSQSPSALVSPFLYRDFCVFWTGSFLSGIGSQFTNVAMGWQIYELTNSAFQIGLLGLARAVPQIILLLVAGLLADAMNRRKLMMCMELGLFCVSMALALLTLAGNASAGMLYTATMLLLFLRRWNNHRGNPWSRIWCHARTWRRHWRFKGLNAMCPSSLVHLSRVWF